MLAKLIKPKKRSCNLEKRWTTCSKNIRSIKRWCNSRKFTAEPGQQKDRDETDKLFEPSTESMKIPVKKSTQRE